MPHTPLVPARSDLGGDAGFTYDSDNLVFYDGVQIGAPAAAAGAEAAPARPSLTASSRRLPRAAPLRRPTLAAAVQTTGMRACGTRPRGRRA